MHIFFKTHTDILVALLLFQIVVTFELCLWLKPGTKWGRVHPAWQDTWNDAGELGESEGLWSWRLVKLNVYIWVVVSSIFCIFNPTWGNDPIWRAYFSIETHPETNIALENRPSQKETRLPTSNHPFSGAMLVFGRVNVYITSLGKEKKVQVVTRWFCVYIFFCAVFSLFTWQQHSRRRVAHYLRLELSLQKLQNVHGETAPPSIPNRRSQLASHARNPSPSATLSTVVDTRMAQTPGQNMIEIKALCFNKDGVEQNRCWCFGLLAISFFQCFKRNWNEKDRLHKEHLACYFWVLAEFSSEKFCWCPFVFFLACQGDVAHRLEANGVGNPNCFQTWQDNGKLFPIAGWFFHSSSWFLTCKGKVCL